MAHYRCNRCRISILYLWLRQGAQGVTLCVCLSVCLSGTKCSKALNLHLSLIGLSQVSLRSVSGQSLVSLRSASGQPQVVLSLFSACSQLVLRSLWAYFVRQTEPVMSEKNLQSRVEISRSCKNTCVHYTVMWSCIQMQELDKAKMNHKYSFKKQDDVFLAPTAFPSTKNTAIILECNWRVLEAVLVDRRV